MDSSLLYSYQLYFNILLFFRLVESQRYKEGRYCAPLCLDQNISAMHTLRRRTIAKFFSRRGNLKFNQNSISFGMHPWLSCNTVVYLFQHYIEPTFDWTTLKMAPKYCCGRIICKSLILAGLVWQVTYLFHTMSRPWHATWHLFFTYFVDYSSIESHPSTVGDIKTVEEFLVPQAMVLKFVKAL